MPWFRVVAYGEPPILTQSGNLVETASLSRFFGDYGRIPQDEVMTHITRQAQRDKRCQQTTHTRQVTSAPFVCCVCALATIVLSDGHWFIITT
eukprot:2959602-Amphidinium_carterae.2